MVCPRTETSDGMCVIWEGWQEASWGWVGCRKLEDMLRSRVLWELPEGPNDFVVGA